MLVFKKVEIADVALIRKSLSPYRVIGCDFAPGNIFIWSKSFRIEFCIDCAAVYFRFPSENRYLYSFPFAADLPDALKRLHGFCGEIPAFCNLNPEQMLYLNSFYGRDFCFSGFFDGREYLYDSKKLIELPGKKYHQKRNHCAKYYKTHTEISLSEIKDNSDINICKSIAENWFTDRYGDSRVLQPEYTAFSRACEHFFVLGFRGAILYSDGRAVAFTMGEELSPDVFDVHFEKTLPDYKDAYPVINCEFAKACLSGYSYINREDDTGSADLRKAKLSYYPSEYVYKFYLSSVCEEDKTPGLKRLWRSVFGDEDYIIDSFFCNVYAESICLSLNIDGDAAAALYLINATVNTGQGSFKGYYLYAAATLEKYRGQGLMSALINEALKIASQSDFIALYPAKEALYEYYERFGFKKSGVLEKTITKNIDESGVLCYSKNVYEYLFDIKNDSSENTAEALREGMCTVFNSRLRCEDIIITENLA